MALAGFQRALADMAMSPENCLLLEENPGRVQADYSLSDLELRRLLHCVEHRGIRVCWSLHRANRLGPINAVLPLTCAALGKDLRRVLERFWRSAPPKDLQFVSEGHRFAAFLRTEINARGALPLGINDIISLELAVAELRYAPERNREVGSKAGAAYRLHPMIRLVSFHYDPEVIIEPLTRGLPLPTDVPEGEYVAIIDARFGPVEVKKAPLELARVLRSFIEPRQLESLSSDTSFLIRSGLIVPHDSL